jgi:DnaJ family protein C protein 7
MDYRRALFSIEQGLKVATASKVLKMRKAECLAYLGRYPEAQNIANDLLRNDNTNADAMFVRGLCLYYEDHVDKAFTHFQQVLRLAPDHGKARETYRVLFRTCHCYSVFYNFFFNCSEPSH